MSRVRGAYHQGLMLLSLYPMQNHLRCCGGLTLGCENERRAVIFLDPYLHSNSTSQPPVTKLRSTATSATRLAICLTTAPSHLSLIASRPWTLPPQTASVTMPASSASASTTTLRTLLPMVLSCRTTRSSLSMLVSSCSVRSWLMRPTP